MICWLKNCLSKNSDYIVRAEVFGSASRYSTSPNDCDIYVVSNALPDSIHWHKLRKNVSKAKEDFYCQFKLQLNCPIRLLSKKSLLVKSKNEIKKTHHGHPSLDQLKGNDQTVVASIARIRKVINQDIPILLQGETGTGKEAFARAIHDESDRANGPFIALNCAAIPESLIESELFGYHSGTFTGARKSGMKGKLSQANGGTIFLDEIGDMPIQLQTRLLRTLAEQEVLPLGAEVPEILDVKVISATHQNLMEQIKNKEFREDFEKSAKSYNVSTDTLKNLRRELRARMGRWPVV